MTGPGLPLTTGEGNTTRDPFTDDALERLARSNMDYYRAHGHYVPPLAQRLLDSRAENTRLREQLDAARQLADELEAEASASLARYGVPISASPYEIARRLRAGLAAATPETPPKDLGGAASGAPDGETDRG